MRKLAVFVVLFVILSFGMLRAIYYRENAQTPFGSEAWKSGYVRRPMIRDLVSNILPGLTRAEIEELLGSSHTPEEARAAGPIYWKRESVEEARERRMKAGYDPGKFYGFDYLSYDWDLMYSIGSPSLTSDLTSPHRWDRIVDPEHEDLLIRLGDDGRFESWYIVDFGQTPWEKIVGQPGNEMYRKERKSN